MLGASYLFTLSFQHLLFVGFALLFSGEILNSKSEEQFVSNHLILAGLFTMNLSFLHYFKSEEIFLVQILLSLLIISSLFIKFDTGGVLEKNKNNMCSVYLILAVYLAVELITLR